MGCRVVNEKLAQLALEPYALGAEHRQRLEEDGFTVFEGVIAFGSPL